MDASWFLAPAKEKAAGAWPWPWPITHMVSSCLEALEYSIAHSIFPITTGQQSSHCIATHPPSPSAPWPWRRTT